MLFVGALKRYLGGGMVGYCVHLARRRRGFRKIRGRAGGVWRCTTASRVLSCVTPCSLVYDFEAFVAFLHDVFKSLIRVNFGNLRHAVSR